nr:uncharacterized protein LOC126056285 [Helicoverpa armigera]
MPQKTCCIPSCASSLGTGAVLHAFPNPSSESDKFHTWVVNAGLAGEDDDYIFRNRRICRLHFEEIYYYPKNRLSKLAVPTLHLSGAPLAPASSRPELIAFDCIQSTASTSSYSGVVLSAPLGSASSKPEAIVVDDIQPTASTSSYSNYITSIARKPSVIPVPYKLQPTTTKMCNTDAFKSNQLNYSEIELYKSVAKMQVKLNRCKKAKARLVQRLKISRKLTRSQAYKMVTKNLSPAAKTFFYMQIRQSTKHPKGRRFTLDEKILALSLYKPSPKAYRLLSQICVLPKKSTLNKLMKNVFLLPGPNNVIFDHLKKRVDKMPETHKYCTVIFDEMAIAANLTYDQHNDQIKGFCDDGSTQIKCFADHALVFMVRGIFKKYKQPVAYTFCAGSTNTISLKNQIKIIVTKILETGLKVVSVTCDQGTSNIAAINLLIKETKEKYLRNNKEYKEGFFEINDTIIYPIFDPPHLIKGMRNNLITKNLECYMDGKKRTAKWAHLEALYKNGPGFKGLRLIPKLTARHVIPNLIPKMKVKYATQVFSKTVSVAMGFIAEIGRIPKESTETAEVLLFFDRLFDSVNGNFSKIVNGKVYRSAVSPKSPHHKLWHKSLPILKTMKFIGDRARLVPSISSWIKTIQSFQQITKRLHGLGLRSILLRNFNQDPLENFFGAIRAHGQRNVMPNLVSFEASYKALLINNMVSPKSVGANCESDDSHCLHSLKDMITQNIPKPLPKPIEIDFNHLNIELKSLDLILSSENPSEIEKCAAVAYCCGWVINLIYKKISKNCMECKKALEQDSEETYLTYLKFITLKKNTSRCILHYPSKCLLECMMNTEIITVEILKTNCESKEIVNYIELVTTTLVSLDFIKCDQHKVKLKEFLLKKFINLVIFNWCKDVSNLLCGKTIVHDQNDAIKELAHNYYVRHKIRNK